MLEAFWRNERPWEKGCLDVLGKDHWEPKKSRRSFQKCVLVSCHRGIFLTDLWSLSPPLSLTYLTSLRETNTRTAGKNYVARDVLLLVLIIAVVADVWIPTASERVPLEQGICVDTCRVNRRCRGALVRVDRAVKCDRPPLLCPDAARRGTTSCRNPRPGSESAIFASVSSHPYSRWSAIMGVRQMKTTKSTMYLACPVCRVCQIGKHLCWAPKHHLTTYVYYNFGKFLIFLRTLSLIFFQKIMRNFMRNEINFSGSLLKKQETKRERLLRYSWKRPLRT